MSGERNSPSERPSAVREWKSSWLRREAQTNRILLILATDSARSRTWTGRSVRLALHPQAEQLDRDEGRLQGLVHLLVVRRIPDVLTQLIHGALARVTQ